MRLLWLPEVLRAAGLKVHEVPGWRTRGSDSWGPIRGVTCHATAGARNGSTSGEIDVLIKGSPSAPPPIAQLYLARNGDYHVVASGRCNHNLVGWAGPNEGLGNYQLVGIEAGNDNRGEPWPAPQLDAYRRGVAAICRRLNLPASRVAGHYEHQPWPAPAGQTSTKSDPLGINMSTFRAAVAKLLQAPPEEDDVSYSKWPKADRKALTDDVVAALLGSKITSRVSGKEVELGHTMLAGTHLYAHTLATEVPGQLAGLTTMVEQLAQSAGTTLTDEQVQTLADAVVAAGGEAGEVLARLAAAGEALAGDDSSDG